MGIENKSCLTEFTKDLFKPSGQKVVVLNWYEDWILINKRPEIVNLPRAIFHLLLLKVFSDKIIWVRHNHKPHARQHNTISRKILCACMNRLAFSVVTHAPASGIKSQIIPHPLAQNPTKKELETTRDIPFLWFGAVRRYKALPQLLAAWPQNTPLIIAGKSNEPSLTTEIETVINARHLKVSWINSYLSDTELNALILRSKYVVLAHNDNSMIVSGAFYHAISLGANILIREGAFADHISKLHSFVTSYSESNMQETIQGLQHIEPTRVQESATAEYGDAIVISAWAQLV
jgi:beta-1,4-mannosyltransferase